MAHTGPRAPGQEPPGQKITSRTTLYYRISEDEWQFMDNPVGVKYVYNSELHLDGSIVLRQKGPTHVSEVVYQANQIQFIDVVERLNIPQNTTWLHNLQESALDQPTSDIGAHGARLVFRIVENWPDIRIFPRQDKKNPSTTPDNSDFPLLQLWPQFDNVMFMFLNTKHVPNWDVRRLLALLRGEAAWNPNNNISHFFLREQQALSAEAKVQLEQLGALRNTKCVIRSQVYRTKLILLKIYPPGELSGMNWERVLYTGQVLEISNPGLFTPRTVVFNKTLESQSFWAARVVQSNGRAPITAVLIDSPLEPERWDAFSNMDESDCHIMPNPVDPTKERADHALERGIRWFEEEDIMDNVRAMQQAQDGLSSRLPLTRMFVRGKDPITEKSFLAEEEYHVDFSGPLAHLNQDQQTASQHAFDYQTYLIWGPPGCAKTATIIYTCESILRKLPDKTVLIVAPTNKAADEITLKFQQRSARIGFDFHQTRFLAFSAGEDVLHSDPNKELNPSYFHNQCYILAKRENYASQYGSYLNGYQRLRTEGIIQDPRARELYLKQRDKIAVQVVGSVRILVCTCATAGLTFLIRNYKPDILFGDESPAMRHSDLLIPLVGYAEYLQRLVLVGDHRQLGSYKTTPEGQAAWGTSTFEEMMNAGWPTIILRHNYRAHQQLVFPTSETFYQRQGLATRQTENPGQYLTTLLGQMNQRDGVRIQDADGQITKITSFAHFFDVTNSIEVTGASKSTKNSAECSCVEAIIKALLYSGVCDSHDIMIIAPYRDQLDELQKMAARGGWDKASMAGGIELNTVHGAQGRERRVLHVQVQLGQRDDFPGHDVFFVVGSKSAIMGLNPTNPLRQVLQCYHETTPGFVLSAGRAPFKVPEEDVLTRAHEALD
ncbi:Helicase MOV-10 [Exophiala xenobiotica]|nr:Helicase MOV-10 [Exophiala xenobiotica]